MEHGTIKKRINEVRSKIQLLTEVRDCHANISMPIEREVFMTWSSIPNFGDEFAKIRERVHSSGARLIEVLYGARNSMGEPTAPESSSDGHGHWLAIEIDGIFQILSWRHPTHEGGHQEYGDGRISNALRDLELDISAKEEICSQAARLSYSQDWEATSAKFDQLSDEWERIFDWETPKEKQLWKQFQTSKKIFYEQCESNHNNNKLHNKTSSMKQEI